MRAMNNRRMQNQPIRSPSPDIVHRSIIKPTQAPVQEIQEQIRKATSRSPHGTSRSPNATSQQSFSFGGAQSDAEKDNKIKALEMQLGGMLKYKENYAGVANENQQLKKQINQMKDNHSYPLKQFDNVKESRSFSAHSSKNEENSSILREFQQRVGLFADENQRLLKEMQSLGRKNEALEKENQFLKSEMTFFKTHPSRSSASEGSAAVKPRNLDQVKNYLLDQLQAKYQAAIAESDRKIKDLELKVDKLQYTQNMIGQKLQSRPLSYSTPNREPKAGDFATTTGRGSEYESRFGGSPPSEHEIKRLRQEIQEADYQKGRAEADNHLLRKKIAELEGSKTPERRPSVSVDIELLNRKVANLEEEKRKLQARYLNNEKELADQQKHIIKSKATNEQELFALKTANRQLQNQGAGMAKEISELKEENEWLRNKIQEQKDLMSQTSQKNEEDIKKLEKNLNNVMKEYLTLLRDIKMLIGGKKIEALLKQNDEIASDKLTLEQRLRLLEREKDSLVSKLKKKILLQEERITELQKEVNLLKAQNQELVLQKNKLKSAILEYTSPEQILDDEDLHENFVEHQGSGENCQLKECLGEAMGRISTLENKMKSFLQGST